MTDEKQPTGTAVRDMKVSEVPGTATEKQPVPAAPPGKKMQQIHAGNVEVVKTQLMSEMNVNLGRIAKCFEIFLKENAPKSTLETKKESDG